MALALLLVVVIHLEKVLVRQRGQMQARQLEPVLVRQLELVQAK